MMRDHVPIMNSEEDKEMVSDDNEEATANNRIAWVSQ
jgi:hypothetical protein